MKSLVLLFVCLASFAIPGCKSKAKTESEPLTAADRSELKNLMAAFVATIESRDERSFPDLIEPTSLRKLMEENQFLMCKVRDIMSSEKLAEIYQFKPDLATALAEQDPEKYFRNIELTEYGKSKLSPRDMKEGQLVSIAGDRTKAYLVLEEDQKAESKEPFYKAWPVVRTIKGWRLDVTTILLEKEKPQEKPGEKLRPEDEKEISNLATILLSGKWEEYPHILNEDDLRQVMKQHQAVITTAYRGGGEYELRRAYTFTPDLKSILREKDPVKYFNGIQPTEAMQEARAAEIKKADVKIAAVAGDRKTAYVILEAQPEIDDDLGSEFVAIRAEFNGSAWHLESNIILSRISSLAR